MISFSEILFLDTETTGLNLFKDDHIFALSWTLGDGPIHYIDTRHESLDSFRRDLDRAGLVIAHGMKFDAHALMGEGIDLTKYDIDCTIIRQQLIDEHLFKYDLASLTGMKEDIIDELAKVFGGPATKNVQMKNLYKADRVLVEKYAKKDVEALRHLYRQQVGEVPRDIHLLEKKVLKVLIRMEQRGVKIDLNRAEEAVHAVKLKVDKTRKELNRLVGWEVNVNSGPQMQKLFNPVEQGNGTFQLIDGTTAPRTKGGKASINADVLEAMTHPAAVLALKIRKYAKIHDTFLISQLLGHQVNSRVHPNFNQCRVVTGRLSCSDPNLQAIPKRDPEMKALLRPLFLPDTDTMLRCDYEQSDIRGFAHYIMDLTKDPDHPIIKAYNQDSLTDFHSYVSDMMGIRRNPGKGGGPNAKQINLAMVFNMGMGRLAKEMDMPYTSKTIRGRECLFPGPEARQVFEDYHKAVPGAADLQDAAAAMATKHGYVTSIMNRHLRFPNKHLAYKASGYLYQSFTADLIKKAMVDTDGIADLHLSVHDELIFSVREEKQVHDIVEAMESALADKTSIPIRTIPEVGQNWGETQKLC